MARQDGGLAGSERHSSGGPQPNLSKLSDDASDAAVAPASDTLVLLDRRAFDRELFVLGLKAADPTVRVLAFATAEEWITRSRDVGGAVAVIFNVEGRRFTDPTLRSEFARVEKLTSPSPLIALSAHEEMSEIVAALELGARGYIPASLGVQAALMAMRLARHGGIFLPSDSVLGLRDSSPAEETPQDRTTFTSRQMAVADALRRGKPNKLIAYELNMCESTVKVHIRNIMKKLGARNRTEASFKINSMMPRHLNDLLE